MIAFHTLIKNVSFSHLTDMRSHKKGRKLLQISCSVCTVDVAIMPSKVIFRSPGRTMFLYTEVLSFDIQEAIRFLIG